MTLVPEGIRRRLRIQRLLDPGTADVGRSLSILERPLSRGAAPDEAD